MRTNAAARIIPPTEVRIQFLAVTYPLIFHNMAASVVRVTMTTGRAVGQVGDFFFNR